MRQNDRALEMVVDQYGLKAATDKAYEEKYIASLQKLLAADPTNTSLQAQIVRAARSGKFAMAKPIVDEAVKQSPGDPELIKLQWSIYRALNDWKGAIAVGEEMVQHDTAAADTGVLPAARRGVSLGQQPREGAGSSVARREQVPEQPDALAHRAQLARRNGQIPQALDAINKVLGDQPEVPGRGAAEGGDLLEQDQVDSLSDALRARCRSGRRRQPPRAAWFLGKANSLFQAYQKDTGKDIGRAANGPSPWFAATLSPTQTARILLTAVRELATMGRCALDARIEARSCGWREAHRPPAKAQDLVRKYGRDFGAAAGGDAGTRCVPGVCR